MDTDTAVPVSKLFMPHASLSDEVNRNIAQSEIEGGVYLDNLPDGEVLEVETENRWYTIVVGRRGQDLIRGHLQSFAAAGWRKNRHGPRLQADDPDPAGLESELGGKCISQPGRTRTKWKKTLTTEAIEKCNGENPLIRYMPKPGQLENVLFPQEPCSVASVVLFCFRRARK